MQLLISDANILIDMEEGELLPQMFQLPYSFSIPDILFYEELEQEHNHLIELGLRLDELEGELVSYSLALVEQYRKPSRNDCFALALAKHHQCLRISVNPIGRFGFIRSLFHLLFRPCSFTLSDRIGLVFSSIRQPVQFDDCCAINGRVMHLPRWGY